MLLTDQIKRDIDYLFKNYIIVDISYGIGNTIWIKDASGLVTLYHAPSIPRGINQRDLNQLVIEIKEYLGLNKPKLVSRLGKYFKNTKRL